MERTITITGLGHMHPEHQINNEFFEELAIGSAAAWVEERTGIRCRYSVLPRETLADLRYAKTDYYRLKAEGRVPTLASLAGKPWAMAVNRRGRGEGMQPDLVICGTSVPDVDIPANAALIAKELGLAATVFDANSACSSFVTDLAIARALLAQGAFASAAVFNVERYSTRLDYSDRSSAVLFGDGAACALLEAQGVEAQGVEAQEEGAPGCSGLRVIDTLLQSDASGADLVKIPIPGCFKQEGARVQKFAISKTCQITRQILARNGLEAAQIAYFVGHQANLRMLQAAADKLGFTPRQHLYNVDHFGNQGAAGAPTVLSQNWSIFRPGDYIVVAVVGSGLSWGAALLQKI